MPLAERQTPPSNAQAPNIVSARDFTLYRSIFDDVGIGIVVLDRQGRKVRANRALARMIEGSPLEHDLIGIFSSWSDTVRTLFDGPAGNLSFEISIPSPEIGGERRLHVTASTVKDIDNQPSHLVCTVEDITAKYRQEEALREAETRYRSIFENAVEGIFQTTADGHYLAANPALARIYGYDTPQDLIASLTNIASQLYVDPRRRHEFQSILSLTGVVENFVSQVYRKDGSVIWISENCRAVCNEMGDLLYYEGMVEDITNRKLAEDRLVHDALHDALTGLPNRTLFLDRLGHVMARSKRRGDSHYAVLFIDCDRFKLINDSLGHQAGDRVLVELSQRISRILRGGDTLARLGGDEFVVLAEELEREQDAHDIAHRIRDALAQPFLLEGEDYYISTSIGIALGKTAYTDAGDVLRDADTAMYVAKNAGRDRSVLFEDGMHLTAVTQLQVANDLRRAVENDDELYVEYQPIYRMEDRTLAGFEALVRWHHPSGEVIMPDAFIPIAEDTGLIHPLGRKVLQIAAGRLAEWESHGMLPTDGFVAVNLSPAQLHRADIVDDLTETVTKSGVSPARIRLEITETGIMHNPASARIKLDTLKARGFQLAIDDFGTGYSSLAQLHRFPIDTLKVDRSFVAAMLHGGEHMEIVKTIILLGQNLGMSLVAEGVETDQHHDALTALKCTYGQGWHYGKSLSARDAGDLLIASP